MAKRMYGRAMLERASSVVCRRSTSFLREVACAERVPAEKRAMKSLSWAIFFSRLALSVSMRERIWVLAMHHFVVAAVVHDDGFVVDVGGVGADAVEEMAVVGDDDEHAFVFQQIILQPVDGIEVEVVGGLVEEQRRRAAEQGLRQQHADFLSALELAHLAFVERAFDAEAVEQGWRRRLPRCSRLLRRRCLRVRRGACRRRR